MKSNLTKARNGKNEKQKRKTGICDHAASSKEDLFLGDILTGITGKKLQQPPVAAGRQVLLIRERTSLDPFAIRVTNEDQQTIGNVSRSAAKWLFPLLQTERISVTAKIPNSTGTAQSLKSQSIPLQISLFRTSLDDQLFEIQEPNCHKVVLHQLVCQAYQLAKGYREPILVEYLINGLRSLAQQELHPQTHLLLALMTGMASQLKSG